MGRKELYLTDDERTEARRRDRMNWYDRNRKRILKGYKIRKATLGASGSSSKAKVDTTHVATPHAKTPTFNGRTTKPLSSTINESDHHDADRVVAPQILLGRVHKQMQELEAFMQADAPTFCVGVANEITLLPTKEHQLEAITIYLERVAAYIDGARPHAVTMFNQFGPTSEWKEARHVQNNMSLAMEYLNEIHHRVETGDLAAAIDLNLLSFQ